MRRINILCLAFTLALCFGACKGFSEKQRAKEDSSKVVKVDNQHFFEVMKPYLNEGFTVKMVPAGNSMLPTIQDNEDVVLLKETQEVEIGDIVLVEIEKGHYIMHRVLKMDGTNLTLKGDNNKGTEKASLTDVLAKVVSIKKGEAKVKDVNNDGRPDAMDTFCKTSSFRLDTKGAVVIKVDTVSHMVDMHRIVTFNETAKTIWNEIEKLEDFTLLKMVEIVTAEYDIDKQTAFDDCNHLLQEWMDFGLVEKKVIHP